MELSHSESSSFLNELNIGWPYEPAVPRLGVCPKELKTVRKQKLGQSVRSSTVTTARGRRSPKAVLWVNGQTERGTVQNQQATKGMGQVTAYDMRDLEKVVLDDRSQTQKALGHVILLLRNLRNL